MVPYLIVANEGFIISFQWSFLKEGKKFFFFSENTRKTRKKNCVVSSDEISTQIYTSYIL